MNRNVVQKILDEHIVEGKAKRGEKVGIKIDQTLTQDATGTMAYLELEAMGIDRVKTELSVSYVDHNMSQFGEENANDHLYLQTVAYNKGIKFSRPGNGICHQVHLERFGIPGKTMLGSDSHTPTGGGLGMMAIGAGGLDVAVAMAGDPFNMPYPEIIGIELIGQLSPWVAAKDVILKLLSILSTKGNVGCIVEYFGEGVHSLSVPQRATITNMGAELGVTTSLFPSDDKTREFLKAQRREIDWVELKADNGAEYDRIIQIDLSELKPMAACPSSPGNIKTVEELEGMPVQQVVIGSCTNSSLKDLMMVAEVLKGKTIHKNTSLMILPGSRQVLKMLAENGALANMVSAGARILESGCGACIGQGASPAEGTVTVRTFNRNFAKRTGTKGDKAYLTSPETAVITALNGCMSSPEKQNETYPPWEMPKEFAVDDSMILEPRSENEKSTEIIRKQTIGDPPVNTEYPEILNGEVLLKVEDKITTDHIMPAGAYLKYRSNIASYSRFVFECFNEEDKPTFAESAEALRDRGKHGIVVAGESYGQGSSREHAAICPMYLGIKAVIVRSIERIHAANLINFGILPLEFVSEEDYNKIGQGDTIIIPDIRNQLKCGKKIEVELTKSSGDKDTIVCNHSLTPFELKTLLAGGRLNL
ncbi:MAG: aconitate hydratase [Verrucomicrobiota bacterium]|nr:aconitate hydratase [Verrucomicrobiota bacterium]